MMQQEYIPVGCVPPACCPYIPAYTATGGVPGPRGVYLVWGWGVPGPGGCTWSQGVYLVWGGVPGLRDVHGPRGCTWSRIEGVYLVLQGCTWSWGVYLVPGVVPPTEFLTHASENITLPQASFEGGNNAPIKNVTSAYSVGRSCIGEINFDCSKNVGSESRFSAEVGAHPCFLSKNFP